MRIILITVKAGGRILRTCGVSAALLAFCGWAVAGPHPGQPILHLLDYIAADYPAVVSGDQVHDQAEYREQREFSGRLAGMIRRLPHNARQTELGRAAHALHAAVERRAPPERVVALSRALAADLTEAYQVPRAPAAPPAPETGAAIYREQCAACHGAEGGGDGPLAAGLEPRPTDFTDGARQARRSVYGLYNTITLGVAGTAMPGFAELRDADRWALAFYTSGFAATESERARGAALWRQGALREVLTDLAAVTGATAGDFAARYGGEGGAVLAYLKSEPAALAGATRNALPWEIAQRRLGESLALYRAGERAAAYDAALAAYLEGFEPMEAGLAAVDSDLRRRVELEMGSYRAAIQRGAAEPELAVQAAAVAELIEHAAQRAADAGLSPMMGAFSAFIILLREGVEAILVLAAIFAFLVKTGRPEALRYVHAGWILALLLGIGTWAAASHLIAVSGADRELSEGVTALIAAAMLLYVGYWLHRNALAHRWKTYLRARLDGALGARPAWTLAAVSFVAVYREVFETILFYEALWLQVPEAGRLHVAGGILAAAGVLAATIWAVFRLSLRLPLRRFFNVNAFLLFLLAVVFVGQGGAALQEAGKLPADPVSFPRIETLGIYPTVETLAMQSALLIAAGVWLGVSRRRTRGAAA